MSRVGRLAGALLAETEGRYFLVGNLKRPCDFAAAGFEAPAVAVDAQARPYLELRRAGRFAVDSVWLVLPLEGEALARELAERMVITRTGSVSDRLWRLILGEDEEDAAPASPQPGEVPAAWVVEMPGRVWAIVRDTVLRCT